MIRLAEIWIYPVKGLGGIRLPKSKVLQKGLEHDRRWMLVDEQNEFLTQRQLPNLALFRVSQKEQGFQVDFDGHFVQFSALSANGLFLRTQVWDDEVEVQEVDTVVSAWFSARLGLATRLVRFAEEAVRLHMASHSGQSVPVSLADAYPLLLTSRASLADLNSRLTQPVSMKRFRPNLVVDGCEAFAEETWDAFEIGASRFQGIKACSRCSVITIDPETARQEKEPLRTLAGYRHHNHKTFFGQNCAPIQTTEIYEGDEILIHTLLEQPVY